MLRELGGVLLTLPLKQRCPILPKDSLPFPGACSSRNDCPSLIEAPVPSLLLGTTLHVN